MYPQFCQLGQETLRRSLKELGGTLIEEYVGALVRVLCLCSKGHPCTPVPSSVSQGGGICLECSGKSPIIAAKKFLVAVNLQGGTMIGTYVRANDRVLCKCRLGHNCYPIPTNAKMGRNICEICSGRSQVEAAKRFKNNIEKIGGIVIGEYGNSLTPVPCKCPKNHDCLVRPCDVRTRTCSGICPECYPKHMGQTRFLQALKTIPNLSCEPEFRFLPDLWRFDFSLLDFKILIEFDGLQHFQTCKWRPTLKDLEDGQQRDRDKMYLASQNGYRMIRFDYTWTWTHLDHVKAAILHCLKQMENPNVGLIVTNPDKYQWLHVDQEEQHEQILNFEIDQSKYLFSGFSINPLE
jgi:hypothetical protein